MTSAPRRGLGRDLLRRGLAPTSLPARALLTARVVGVSGIRLLQNPQLLLDNLHFRLPVRLGSLSGLALVGIENIHDGMRHLALPTTPKASALKARASMSSCVAWFSQRPWSYCSSPLNPGD
jgi:hypothetical protein